MWHMVMAVHGVAYNQQQMHEDHMNRIIVLAQYIVIVVRSYRIIESVHHHVQVMGGVNGRTCDTHVRQPETVHRQTGSSWSHLKTSDEARHYVVHRPILLFVLSSYVPQISGSSKVIKPKPRERLVSRSIADDTVHYNTQTVQRTLQKLVAGQTASHGFQIHR
jgi:hypothetical protein